MNYLLKIRDRLLHGYPVEVSEVGGNGRFQTETYHVKGVEYLLTLFDGLPQTLQVGSRIMNARGEDMIGEDMINDGH